MNTWQVNSEVVYLLSKITGQDLNPRTIRPLFIFVAAAIAVLRGVMVMDKVVVAEEEARLLDTLDVLLDEDEEVYRLTQLTIRGIDREHIYLDPQALLTLSNPLSLSARLLLLAFGYEMSAADGTIDFREQMYLHSIASRLQIEMPHLQAIEAGFTRDTPSFPEGAAQVRELLGDDRFEEIDPILVKAARYMRSKLEMV
ncbi:TerB family tellurite resistance protein [Oscillatoriales cyanobacterium LEGE 11467]|uniref:TerB family tellurite resistance protein n=1 Tax=Zarconia navalis LEGE 11467 TaxID=1828826 RepID=A0A928VV98_9CYAN|nr:TerB family tellurite resistance protein [Zarconia navalis]MBE9040887.1 TerB family tellurite resistance protein [Zarconia navalis LEGE 11467]